MRRQRPGGNRGGLDVLRQRLVNPNVQRCPFIEDGEESRDRRREIALRGHGNSARAEREREAMVAFRRAYAEADEAGQDRAECYQAAFAAYDAELRRPLATPPPAQEAGSPDGSAEAA